MIKNFLKFVGENTFGMTQGQGNYEKAARKSLLVIVPFVAFVLSAAILISPNKSFWIDEIYTVCIAEQPSVADMLAAIREGCDQQPPLYALIVHATSPLITDRHLNVRLPSAVGIGLMCFCLFYYMRRYVSGIYAFMTVLMTYNLVSEYAIEGRCYGLVLGFVALALLCLQIATHSNRYRKLAIAGLFVSMTIAIALHYYTILVIIAIFTDVVCRWVKNKQADLAVILVCVISPMILLLHVPFFEASKQLAVNYWAKIKSLEAAYIFYNNIISPLSKYFIVGCLAYLVIIFIRASFKSKAKNIYTKLDMPWCDYVPVLVLALLPLLMIMISLLTVKIFLDRYVMWSIIGICILATLAISKITRNNQVVALAIVLLALYDSISYAAYHLKDNPHLPESENIRIALQQIPYSPKYIVIADHHAYMENWFYSSPQLRERLVYPLSIEFELHYTKTDTGPRILKALRNRTTINAPDYSEFMQRNQEFFLVTNKYEWLVPHLARTGYILRPVFSEFNTIIYDVQRK